MPVSLTPSRFAIASFPNHHHSREWPRDLGGHRFAATWSDRHLGETAVVGGEVTIKIQLEAFEK
jgi:hypothetical protein